MSQDIKTVATLVREMELDDKQGTTTSSRYVSENMRENIDRTEAYLNSKHISGDTDYMGREKPFFNIVLAARNIWYRATDIDRRQINVMPTKNKDVIPAFLASILLQQWFKEVNFSKFLNDWGLTLSTHGSAITKFIEKDGELSCQVVDWNNILCDQVDFENNIKIEKLWYTPAQLRKQKGYNKDMVEALLQNTTTRKTMGGQKKDNKSDYICVYEVHGELSMAQYKISKDEEPEEGDENEFFQQMHVISYQAKRDNKKSYEDYTLYSGRESKDPYHIAHLIKKDGQTYAGGAVKNLFEAQWIVNHTQKMIKDQLDLASKIVFQTSDGSFVGQNVLTNIENGDILHWNSKDGGSPLTMLNNKPDINAMQSFKADWQNISNQINGISEAMAGQNPPSGTAWRQTQALLQESHSLFELMAENKGISLIEMLTTYVIPFFKKKLDNSDEIASTLEEHQIKKFDSMYLPNETIRRMNQKKKETILSGKIWDSGNEITDMGKVQEEVKQELTGNQRFVKPSEVSGRTWKELFKDLEWKLDIDVTGENKDVQGALSTLTTVLTTMVSNPAVLQDPNIKMVFNKILSLTGSISPLELSYAEAAAPVQPPVQAPMQMPAQKQQQPA